MGRSCQRSHLRSPFPPTVIEILDRLLRRERTSLQQARRIQIVLGVAQGESNAQLARRLCLREETVTRWRDRFATVLDELDQPLEELTDRDLEHHLLDALKDCPRSGAPGKFTAEQICAIIALALEDPADSGRPISHWSRRELADEAVKRRIAEEISARTVGRILDEADLKPHKSQYWLNPKIDDLEFHDEQVRMVCDAYEEAIPSYQQEVHTVSVDEKTSIQALERIAPTLPMKPGTVERREFEYARHGTLALIPSFEVATGQIICSSIGPTRTEDDFADHISRTIDTDTQAQWIFVADQLNTHKSEALVRLIAQRCSITDDLGNKEKEGILKSQETRSQFLSDPSHRIRFIYTPKHCSWLNQVEIWFGILARKLLRRASFTSVHDLRQRISAFIDYFNKTMSKPFKWTYKGRPLQA
jgi:transposase